MRPFYESIRKPNNETGVFQTEDTGFYTDVQS